MTQEIAIQAGIELTQVAINPTLNKEQNIFMSTDTVTAKVVENASVESVTVEANTNGGGAGPVANPNSNEVLQKFINDELTPESLRIYARRELERMQVEKSNDLRAKWDKAKREAKKGTIDAKSIEAAIAKGHAPEDVTSKGIYKITAKEVIENSSITEENEMDPKAAKALLDKEVLTPREQTQLLLTHKNRLLEAERVLGGKKLNIEQKLAILKAHYVGFGEEGEDGNEAGVYNLKQEHVTEKARILEKSGLEEDQRRAIIESGLTVAPPPGGAPPAPGTPEFYENDIVRQIVALNAPGFHFADAKLEQFRTTLINVYAAAIPGSNLGRLTKEWVDKFANETYRYVTEDNTGAAMEGDELIRALKSITRNFDLIQGKGRDEEAFAAKYDDLERTGRIVNVNINGVMTDVNVDLMNEVRSRAASINPSGNGIPDFMLKMFIEGDPYGQALEHLVIRIAGQPLQSESGDYRLGFYGGINLEAIKNLLETLSENKKLEPNEYLRKLRRNQLDDINTIERGIQFIHELNKNIVTNNPDGAAQLAAQLQPEFLNRFQRIKGVGLVMRMFEVAHPELVSREGMINNKNYAKMMGFTRDSETGKVSMNQTSSVYEKLDRLWKRSQDNRSRGINDLGELSELEGWQVRLAYNIGRNLFNLEHRGIEWISLGQYHTGTRQWESPPQEGFVRIMNFGRWMLQRFTVGNNRGGLKWLSYGIEAMQRARGREGYGKMQLDTIKGNDKISDFELANMTGTRGYWATWRSVGGLMRQITASYDARGSVAGLTPIYGSEKEHLGNVTRLGKLLDTDEISFGKVNPATGAVTDQISWKAATDVMKADYYRSVFFQPGSHHLRNDLQIGLGPLLKIALGPAGGHHAHAEHHLNEVKEEIRAAIWAKVARENPLAVVPFLHGLKYSKSHRDGSLSGKSIDIYDKGASDAHVDWDIFAEKLSFFNELKMARIKELTGPGVPPGTNFAYSLQDAIRDYEISTGKINPAGHVLRPADPSLELTDAEKSYMITIAKHGEQASHDLANVRVPFIPFLDVLFERADYEEPGAESMRRHYADLGQLNSSNSGVIKIMDNVGQIVVKDVHATTENFREIEKGITGVHGDKAGKAKLYPWIEASMRYHRRGENGTNKFSRFMRQQDEINTLFQKFRFNFTKNSDGQVDYNFKMHTLDLGQIYEYMEDFGEQGLMGEEEEEELKKKMWGGSGLLFILRLMWEGTARGVKAGTIVSGMELLKRSFKGSVQ